MTRSWGQGGRGGGDLTRITRRKKKKREMLVRMPVSSAHPRTLPRQSCLPPALNSYALHDHPMPMISTIKQHLCQTRSSNAIARQTLHRAFQKALRINPQDRNRKTRRTGGVVERGVELVHVEGSEDGDQEGVRDRAVQRLERVLRRLVLIPTTPAPSSAPEFPCPVQHIRHSEARA
eukprot:3540442-Rhodomonas_salina.3